MKQVCGDVDATENREKFNNYDVENSVYKSLYITRDKLLNCFYVGSLKKRDIDIAEPLKCHGRYANRGNFEVVLGGTA